MVSGPLIRTMPLAAPPLADAMATIVSSSVPIMVPQPQIGERVSNDPHVSDPDATSA